MEAFATQQKGVACFYSLNKELFAHSGFLWEGKFGLCCWQWYSWWISWATDLYALVCHPSLKLFLLLAICTRPAFVECFVFLAVRVSVQPNAHLHSLALNACQAVVSSGEKWDLVNKMLMHWYGVLFSILNWKESLQIACYILALLGNLVEKKYLYLFCIPSRLCLSEKTNSIFQMWILQEIAKNCSIFSVYSVLQMWFLQFSWGSDCLINLKGKLPIQEQSPQCLRIGRKNSYYFWHNLSFANCSTTSKLSLYVPSFFPSRTLVQVVMVLLSRFKLEWAAWMVRSSGNLDHEVNYARMLSRSQTRGIFWEAPDSLAISQEMSWYCESYFYPSFLTGKIILSSPVNHNKDDKTSFVLEGCVEILELFLNFFFITFCAAYHGIFSSRNLLHPPLFFSPGGCGFLVCISKLIQITWD